MKNKKSIYVLLPLVAIIWGSIIYQFFSYSSTEDNQAEVSLYDTTPFEVKMKDTFSITINPRDPFLGKLVNMEAQTGTVKKRSSFGKIKKETNELVWPQIKYKGIVSDTKDKVKVYMVIIDGKTCLMKTGVEESAVLLKKGDKDMIYVIYKGEDKVVFIE